MENQNPVPENTVIQKEEVVKKPQKKEKKPKEANTKIPIYLSIILATVLMIFLAYTVNEKNEPKSNDLFSSSNSSSNTPIIVNMDGVFQNDTSNISVSIIKIDEKNAALVNKNNEVIVNFGKIENNKIILEDKTEIILNEDYMIITDIYANNLAGNYTKTNNYTLSDYYADTFARVEFLTSLWNGIYILNDTTVKIYQIDSQKLMLNVVKNNDSSNIKKKLIYINNGKLYINNESGELTITQNVSGISISSIKGTNEEDYLNLNGIFIKERAYTFDEIINDLT